MNGEKRSTGRIVIWILFCQLFTDKAMCHPAVVHCYAIAASTTTTPRTRQAYKSMPRQRLPFIHSNERIALIPSIRTIFSGHLPLPTWPLGQHVVENFICCHSFNRFSLFRLLDSVDLVCSAYRQYRNQSKSNKTLLASSVCLMGMDMWCQLPGVYCKIHHDKESLNSFFFSITLLWCD